MPKRLISCLFLSLCMCFALSLSAGVKAEAYSVQAVAGYVTVTVSDAPLEGQEMSIVCYDPSWNGSYTDWKSSESHVVYMGQVKISGVTTVNFRINNSVTSGYYTLVTSAGGQKTETKFQFKVHTGGLLQPILPPDNVKAVQTAAAKVKVSWNKASEAVKYTVYRSEKKNSGYKKISDTAACSYTDKKCKAGKTYYYKVTSVNLKESPQSKAAKVKLMAAPKIKVAVKGKTATVSWKKIKGVKGYRVYTSQKKKGKYKQAANLKKASKVKCTIKLGNKKSCYIKVRAYKKNGKKIVYGKYSAVKKAGK